MRTFRTRSGPKLSPVEVKGDPSEISLEILGVKYGQNQKRIEAPRASSLYSACMRQHVFCTLLDRKTTENLPVERVITFDIGNALHHWVQNSPTLLGDSRRGVWKCQACGRKTFFGPPPDRPCPQCKASPNVYVYNELSLKVSDPYILTGHPDMFIEKDGLIRLVEIKTINGEDFEKLIAPLIPHVWQLNAYLWACSTNPFQVGAHIDPECGYVLYISKKERRGMLPFKTFVVKQEEFIMTAVFKKLELYMQGLKGDLPPVQDTCLNADFTSWQARSCPVVSECRSKK